MRLLEVRPRKASSKEVIATCMQTSKSLGKVGVLVGNCRGFVGNRMFGPYRREAQFLVEEGAGIEAVDQALSGFGMADTGRVHKAIFGNELNDAGYFQVGDILCGCASRHRTARSRWPRGPWPCRSQKGPGLRFDPAPSFDEELGFAAVGPNMRLPTNRDSYDGTAHLAERFESDAGGVTSFEEAFRGDL